MDLGKIIRFENEDFIVVDKPAGWLSVAGRDSRSHCLLHHLSQWRKCQFWPIHRLDQPVGGLILYGKNRGAHRIANQWFENRSIRKVYEALSDGHDFPAPGSRFKWQHTLLRGKKRAYERPFGKLAETEGVFTGVRQVGERNLGVWTLHPKTGRAHQLRFQLSKAGFPIWGDRLYGSCHEFENQCIALRAVELDFSRVKGARLGLPQELRVEGIWEWITLAPKQAVNYSQN